MNKLKHVGLISLVTLLFCFYLNAELTSQISRTNLFQSNFSVKKFDISSTSLDIAPWYNPVLSGHYTIDSASQTLLLVKTTDQHFIAADSNALILMVLTSPKNIIIFFSCILLLAVYIKKQSRKQNHKHKLSQLNLQANKLLESC